MSSYKKVSLSEINQSIETPDNNHFWQNLKAFLGPGALVAVGYMDPGNWITSVVGGASYKYSLLFAILISSIIAMQLQQMAGKLGIVTRMDLALATAHHAPKWFRYSLWVILELALIATDLAEVLGSAIALNLLFKIPIKVAILLTVLDVFLIWWFYLIRVCRGSLVIICRLRLYLKVLCREMRVIDFGFRDCRSDSQAHNLYLHSFLSQTRKINHKHKKDV